MKVVQISESAFTVQGHGVHTAYIETLSALKQRPGITVATNTRAPADIRHIHTVGMYALDQLLFGKGKKIVSAHLVPDSLVGSLRGAVWWKGFATWYLKVFYNRADAVIAVSDETKQELIRIGVTKPIEVIYNMINTQLYKPAEGVRRRARKRLGIDPHAWVVASNGQVQPRKRVDTFIRLARELPNMQFIWIGGIPFKAAAAHYETMKQLMAEAPENVQFTGVVPLDDVKDYLHAADVFLMPSEQETFGLAIVEAAASGLPVVLRDIPDYNHTFRPYAAMCSEAEFTLALQRLHDDHEVYEKAKDQSKQLAAVYDSEMIVRKLIALYKKVLAG